MYIETNKKSMKRIIIIGSLVSCALLALTGEVQAQSGIEQVLKNIEANNKELQANAQLITSQKLEATTVKEAKKVLSTSVTEYWETHYTFGSMSLCSGVV